ncbi:DUF551 domain-containing protein [Escherichia coli]|nr:DUF551 domain-containing protein [Escherichia coli]
MTTMTKERLLTIKQWRETYGPGSNVVLPAEEAEELARIALASLEAKSRKLFTCSGCGAEGLDEPLESKCHCNEDGAHWVEGIVYTAQPAQVSVPDAATAIRACIDEFPESVRDVVEECASIAENACRAAMLHGAGPISQAYKLNALDGNSPVTPDGWIPVSERMPEPYEYVLVTDGFDGCEVMRVNTDGYWGPAKSLYPGGITHWMPLPEPPQEVNRG